MDKCFEKLLTRPQKFSFPTKKINMSNQNAKFDDFKTFEKRKNVHQRLICQHILHCFHHTFVNNFVRALFWFFSLDSFKIN
jgi:hypothetical protein